MVLRIITLDEDNRIWWGKDGDNVPRLKRFLSEVKDGVVPQTFWSYSEVGHTQEAKEELIKYVDFEEDENVLNSVKPSRLIQRMIQVGTKENENDIILDFFGGSGTTAQAVLNQNHKDSGNRRFVVIQLPEPLNKEEKSVKSIADLGKSRIVNVINEIGGNLENQESQDNKENKQLDFGSDIDGSDNEEKPNIETKFLGFQVFKLTPSNFKVWDSPKIDIDPEELEEQLDVFADHITPEAERESILYEMILKSGYPLTTSIEEKRIEGKTVYSIQDGTLLIYLDEELTFEVLDQIAEMEPDRVVCLDKSFSGEQADALKTNAVQLFKSHDIAFRTV